jgi:hypothetical protein
MDYGTTYTPSGASAPVKIRGPVFVGLMTFFTVGLYAIYWVYVTATELRTYGQAHGRDLGQRPGRTLLAMTAGWLVIVPPFVAMYRQARRIQQAQRIAGEQPMNGWIDVLLYITVTPLFFSYQQLELNKLWAADGAPVPTMTPDAPPLAA